MSGNIVDKLRRGTLSRREFHAAMASIGLGLAMLPLARPARAAAKLTVFTWSGYDVPELIPRYIAKYGGPPEYSIFGSEEEALQKLLAGFVVDVMHPCSYNIKRWKDAGVLQPIDVSRLSEYTHIWEKFRTLPETSFDGQTYFVPYDIGTSSIIYRTDLVDPADVADPSWGLLFNEKYKGKLSMYDTDTTFVEIAGRVLGMEKDYLHLNDAQLGKIKALLIKQRDLMKFYWSDQTQMEQAVAAGELVAAYSWSASYKTLGENGVKVAYMTPKEGLLGYCCGFVRHAESPGDEQAAYDFIDAMLDPESGKLLVEQGFFHSNERTYALVDQATLEALGAKDPAKTFAALTIDPEADEPYRSKYIALVNEVKAGL